MWASVLTRQIVGKNCLNQLRMASSSASGTITPKLYALQYKYVEDAFEKRKPHRSAHLAFVGQHVEKGNVILGGAVDNPPTGGLIIFRNLSRNDIEQFAQQDPYVVNGVVSKYTIKPYMVVVGDDSLKDDFIKI